MMRDGMMMMPSGWTGNGHILRNDTDQVGKFGMVVEVVTRHFALFLSLVRC
jgi:hypothetical protein